MNVPNPYIDIPLLSLLYKKDLKKKNNGMQTKPLDIFYQLRFFSSFVCLVSPNYVLIYFLPLNFTVSSSLFYSFTGDLPFYFFCAALDAQHFIDFNLYP